MGREKLRKKAGEAYLSCPSVAVFAQKVVDRLGASADRADASAAALVARGRTRKEA